MTKTITKKYENRALQALTKAAKLAGSIAALGRLINVTPQSIHVWRRCKRCPAERAIQIEKALNGQVTRAELRPDLFADGY